MSYQIYADGDREFKTMNARVAASMYGTWRLKKLNPRAWVVVNPAEGPVKMVEVPPHRTEEEHTKAMTKARRELLREAGCENGRNECKK